MQRLSRLSLTLLPCLSLLTALLLFVSSALAQSGSLDPAFGGTGLVTTPLNPSARAYDIVVEPLTNKYIVAGRDYGSGGNSYWAILRYNPDGTLDNSYGVNGKVILFGKSTTDTAYDVALDSANRAVVTGITKLATRFAFTVVRLTVRGALDSSFGMGGIVQTHIIRPTDDLSYALGIEASTGKIIVAGTVPGRQSLRVALVRYHGDGSLDTTFGVKGKRIDDISPLNDFVRNAGLVVQNDGKIVIAASSGSTGSPGANDWIIARYNTDGRDDNSFGTNGKVVGVFNGLTFQKVWGLALQDDGKIVASGRALTSGASYHHLVARYNSNGTLDPTFDGDGWNITTTSTDNQGIHSAIQSDGKIVVAGSYYTGAVNLFDIIVTRFNSNGTLDLSFDGDGQSQFTGIPGNIDAAQAVAVDPNGKIVAAGNSGSMIAVARYFP